MAMHGQLSSAILLSGLALVSPSVAEAACNATLNGRPMPIELCRAAVQVYGSVVPGDYLMDRAGNWVNLNNPAHAGNIYRDAQGGQDSGGGQSEGLTRTPFGSVGGGYYFDNEIGSSAGR
jgi:hypothetical protein